MEFDNNIFELNHKNKTIKFDFLKEQIPKGIEVFFRAKQMELFEQYQSARLFLRETAITDWSHWFDELDECDKEYQEVVELGYTHRFFESSLMYYNIIVDLSWVLCYVSAEYTLYEKGHKIDISNTLKLEDAYEILRKAENSVINPTSELSQFQYLKTMSPEFTDSIDLVMDFWKKFKDSSTRKLYNFIKHKGKPQYKEIQKYYKDKLFEISINNKKYLTDTKDVQMLIGLKESINELKQFDDEILFPYVKNLFELLEMALKPSRLIL